MASPFLNPLHTHLPATPSAGPAIGATDDDAYKSFNLNENEDRLFSTSSSSSSTQALFAGTSDKDDLATIASHLSLNSPKKTKKRTSSPR